MINYINLDTKNHEPFCIKYVLVFCSIIDQPMGQVKYTLDFHLLAEKFTVDGRTDNSHNGCSLLI